ncbi:MAG: hypothetical protein AB7E55_32025, partial [Pigmentiphaga sp.]
MLQGEPACRVPIHLAGIQIHRQSFTIVVHKHLRKRRGKTMMEFFYTLSWVAVFQIIMIDILLG